MSKLEAIMDIFSAYGKADTPVAIIQNGTTDNEKVVIGKVKDIAFKSQYAQLTNPAIIIVGEVVKFHSGQFKNIVPSAINFKQAAIQQ